MLTLLVVGFAGGLITSISPCVLPVLPVVLTAGVTGRRTDAAAGPGWRRPVGVVLGLVVSFSLSTLLGTTLLSALGLPQDLLRDLGVAVLVLIGVSLFVPRLGELLERPFARLGARRSVSKRAHGFVLGLGLGLLYVPCAGPVLATIAVVGATHRIGPQAVLLTAAFGVGVGVPLLIVALAGEALTERVTALRRRARALRVTSGAVMIATAMLIAFDLTDGLQRQVPGYTAALQNSVEGNADVTSALNTVKRGGDDAPRAPAAGDLGGPCTPGGSQLQNCGRAPNFTGISGWLNTAGNAPLTLTALRGKVVLLDFWTYSCINCQRSLPHVEGWYREYAKNGLVVVGVHTPEFAFEHVRSNVVAQAAALGVKYPIAIDNDYKTWNAYDNQYWPAEYLIDANGNIRHIEFGESGYTTTQSLIRQLLLQAKPGTELGGSTDLPAHEFDANQTPETYLGVNYAPLRTATGVHLEPGRTVSYSFPAAVNDDRFALAGTWTTQPENLLAGSGAQLQLNYEASDCYVVLGGTGRVAVSIDGRTTTTIRVDGVPRLYTVHTTADPQRHLLTLAMSPGVQAYSFTFG